jgi:hypothetical protein
LIWIVYDRDRQGAGEILLATFREEDVVAGKMAPCWERGSSESRERAVKYRLTMTALTTVRAKKPAKREEK